MTPDDRQALREKHGKFGFRDNRTFCVFCLDDDGLDITYPCDVIKVLDWADEELAHYHKIKTIAFAKWTESRIEP